MSGPDPELLELPALPAGDVLVLSTDTSVSGVHFPPGTAIDDIAHKALAVNLSDLAAMGAYPLAVQAQVHGPPDHAPWCARLCRSLAAAANQGGLRHHVAHTPACAVGVSVLALGRVEGGGALTRDGARVGDEIWVSGSLGDAGGGLALIQGGSAFDAAGEPELRQRLDRPSPRLALGQALKGVAHCAIDLSDGLSGDLAHITRRSAVAAQLWLEALPLSPALLGCFGRSRAQDLALGAGDDYELCFTAPVNRHQAVLAAGRDSATPVHRVGRIVVGSGVQILDPRGGQVVPPRAFTHAWDPP